MKIGWGVHYIALERDRFYVRAGNRLSANDWRVRLVLRAAWWILRGCQFALSPDEQRVLDAMDRRPTG